MRPQRDLSAHTWMGCRLREATSEELELCSGEGVCQRGERRSHRKPGKWGGQIWGQEFHDFEAVGQVTASWLSVLHGGAAALILGTIALKVKDWRSCLGQRRGDKA